MAPGIIMNAGESFISSDSIDGYHTAPDDRSQGSADPEPIDIDNNTLRQTSAPPPSPSPTPQPRRIQNENVCDYDTNDLFLVKFVHDQCGPYPTACNPWQSVDLTDILYYRENFLRPATATGPPNSSNNERVRTVMDDPRSLLDRTFGMAVDLVMKQEHPPRRQDTAAAEAEEEGEEEEGGRRERETVVSSSVSFSRPRLKSVHVYWAGPPMGVQGGGGGGVLGVSSNLLRMPHVKTVQQQLELVRRRDHRDWLEVHFESVGDGDRGGDDAPMDSFPAPLLSFSSYLERAGLNDGNNNNSLSGPSAGDSGQEQQGNDHMTDHMTEHMTQDSLEPDSQELIW